MKALHKRWHLDERAVRAALAKARHEILESPNLGFGDPPALAIDRFIHVLLGGDGSSWGPLTVEEIAEGQKAETT